MKDTNDLIVGMPVGNRASYKSETRKLGAAKFIEGARSRANCNSGRYASTSNISNVIGSMGMPEIENPLKRSNKPARFMLPCKKSSILIDRFGLKLGTNSISKEKESAFKSRKDGANPKATAMWGRKRSIGNSPLGKVMAKVKPDGRFGILTPLKVGYGKAMFSLSQSIRFNSKEYWKDGNLLPI